MRALIFDVDNTLTPPRRPLPPEMAAALGALPLAFYIAAGSDLSIVEAQFVRPLHGAGFRGTFDAFVCNGSDRYRFELDDGIGCDTLRVFSLRDHLGAGEFAALVATLQDVIDEPRFRLPTPLAVVGERIIDRGSMINLAPIGRPTRMTPEAYRARDAFVAFDERTGYRRRMLDAIRAALAPSIASGGLRVTFGGQTSFDIVVAENDKTYPLRQLLSEGYTQLTYFGDALFAGGNDAAVLEFVNAWPRPPAPIVAVQVRSWQDTLARLRDLIRSHGASAPEHA